MRYFPGEEKLVIMLSQLIEFTKAGTSLVVSGSITELLSLPLHCRVCVTLDRVSCTLDNVSG